MIAALIHTFVDKALDHGGRPARKEKSFICARCLHGFTEIYHLFAHEKQSSTGTPSQSPDAPTGRASKKKKDGDGEGNKPKKNGKKSRNSGEEF